MRRTLPLSLSLLPFLLFALFLLPTWPASAANAEDASAYAPVAQVQAQLAAQALATPAQVSPAAEPVPELGLGELGSLIIQAFTGKQWGLLGVLGLVGLVLLLRKVGRKWLPWLDTPHGAVLLSLVGGTSTLLAVALGSGTPFTLGLVLSCLMTAAGASGLWSWGQTLRNPNPAIICTPREIENGNCPRPQ